MSKRPHPCQPSVDSCSSQTTSESSPSRQQVFGSLRPKRVTSLALTLTSLLTGIHWLPIQEALQGASAQTSALPTFSCNSDFYVSQGDDLSSPSQLNNLTINIADPQPFNLSTIPAGANSNTTPYNAIGYNQLDNYLYGVQNDPTGTTAPHNVVRIGADGRTEVVRTIPDPGNRPNGDVLNYVVGDVIVEGGIPYLYASIGTLNTFYRVNLANPSAPAEAITRAGDITSILDFAFHPTNGKLYGIRSNAHNQVDRLVEITISGTTATVNTLSLTTPLPGNNFGAVFFDSNGTFYVYHNGDSGVTNVNVPQANLYAIDLDTLTFTHYGEAANVNQNDGARCAGAPPPSNFTDDTDGDEVLDIVEGSGDRDGDSVPNYQDFDPQGYFYDEATGEIIAGGSISVTPPAGGSVNLINNGSATGAYQWTASGASGVYTMTVTPPAGYELSSSCLNSDPPAYNPTGNSNPDVLGAGEDGSTGNLTSSGCVDNTFYLSFELEPGDPIVMNNNLPLAAISAGNMLAPPLGDCFGSGCVTPYPNVGTYTSIQGRDNAYSVFIGGNLTIEGAAEAEGGVFVGGNFTLNKSGGVYNVGWVGVGSFVVPDAGEDYLAVGGDISIPNGATLIIGGSTHGGESIAGNLRHKGSIPGNGIDISGSIINDSTLDLSAFQAKISEQQSNSACYAGLAQSANVEVLDQGYQTVIRSTDGASGTYVVNINRDIQSTWGATGLEFTNFPDDATVLINVTDTAGDNQVTLNLNDITRDGTSLGAFTLSATDRAFREKLFWNFPDSVTAVNFTGFPQFQGSVLVANANSTTTIGVPGMNGRFLSAGDVIHLTGGSEFHNYPFRGTLPTNCSTPTPTLDYGDAPVSGTAPDGSGTNNYGAAAHSIDSGVYLGASAPDADSANQPTANADGDDNDGNNDDDGVAIPTLAQGQTATMTATVAGAGGYLQGWIDWNGDGTFSAGEQVATNLQDNGTGDDATANDGTITFDVAVPANAITSANTFARFRWSTTQNLDTTTTASDGEVEDYGVAIATPSTPNLLVVERITAINRGQASEILFDTTYQDVTSDDSDNYANWPNPVDGTSGTSTYLAGAIDRNLDVGDQVEYTIYFISSGTKPITNVNICNMVPANTTYVDGSLELSFNGSTTPLTDTNTDSDGGEFIAAPTLPSTPCPETSNDHGAVVVNVVRSPETLPHAVAPGDPGNSYGYIRFRVTVD